MKKYISTKLVEATKKDDETYEIRYKDGYIGTCPARVFEESYLEVEDNPVLPSGVSVGPKMVEDFIKEVHVSKVGEKTTVVRVVLKNGFEIVESSACVDAANYCEEIGIDVCMKKIKDRIWGYLGFLLQTAFNGIK